LALPSLFGVCCLLAGLKTRSPGLFLGLMLQAIASPMMAAPAFAAVLGLDATLVLTTLVTSTAVTPFTAPFFAYAFIGPALTLSPLVLALKLFTILAGSLLVAAGIRYLVGIATIRRYSDQINGLNILLVFLFVAAVMENVANQVRGRTFKGDRTCGAGFRGVFLRARANGYRFGESGRS
jgi:predicted Na+-dependent transporter